MIIHFFSFFNFSYAKNIDRTCWHNASLIMSNVKDSGFFNNVVGKKRMGFSVGSLSKNCIKIGDKLYSKTLDKSFQVRTIYISRKKFSEAKHIYKHIYKKYNVKNLRSFDKTFQGFNPLYACYISWLNNKEPEEYITIFPCK